MSNLFGVSDQLPYLERCTGLVKKRVVLWDVCKTFVRKGSSDSAIKTVEANRIHELLIEFPSIQTIACNGRTSANLLKRYVQLPAGVRVIVLPSSSPAHAMKNAVRTKTEKWRELFEIELLEQIELKPE
jgi:double-stranded uracil-DNA glycosylase